MRIFPRSSANTLCQITYGVVIVGKMLCVCIRAGVGDGDELGNLSSTFPMVLAITSMSTSVSTRWLMLQHVV